MTSTSYDAVPYPAFPNRWSHPDHLATLAKLFGLEPPEVENCRVLELGCSDGGNLIPLAQVLPESRFVGVDSSSQQIEAGRRVSEAAGLSNVELQHRSILDVGLRDGRFDYIICHGVYSWVPPLVQEKILQICAEQLSPRGVAFVSYNTYPGWHMRGMIRDMMCFHARRFTDPQRQIEEARLLLNFLSEAAPGENDPFGLMLRREINTLSRHSDSYLYHEQLEEYNDPVYFHQFAERAKRAGLQYLAEADLASMISSNLSPKIADTLEKLAPDLVHMEQYMDFVRQRQFRSTLLCRADLRLNRKILPQSFRGMYVAAPTVPVQPDPDLHSVSTVEFQAGRETTLSASAPVMKAALACLGRAWPCALAFDSLPALAYSLLNPVMALDPEHYSREAHEMANSLLDCLTMGVLELRMHPSRFTVEIGDRPTATPLARYQAAQGGPVTTLRHESSTPSDFNRRLLRLLDGSRGRSDLIETLSEQAACGSLLLAAAGRPVRDLNEARPIVADLLDRNLPQLAQEALLSLWSRPL